MVRSFRTHKSFVSCDSIKFSLSFKSSHSNLTVYQIDKSLSLCLTIIPLILITVTLRLLKLHAPSTALFFLSYLSMSIISFGTKKQLIKRNTELIRCETSRAKNLELTDRRLRRETDSEKERQGEEGIDNVKTKIDGMW